MKRRLTSLLSTVAICSEISIAIGESSEVTKVISAPQHKQQQQQSHLRSSNNNLRRVSSTDNINNINNNNINNNKRRLGTQSYCGNNWQTAHDSCSDSCTLDEDCGPGNYCFHYISCTPPSSNNDGIQQKSEPVPAPSLYQPMSAQVPSGAVSGEFYFYSDRTLFFATTMNSVTFSIHTSYGGVYKSQETALFNGILVITSRCRCYGAMVAI